MSLPTAKVGLQRPNSGPLIDAFGRTHTYMRVSLTDRCNFRCTYCMPEEGLQWMAKERLLRFEEIVRIVTVMVGMGVHRVRLTGGEPTLRKDMVELVRMLTQIDGLTDLSMTTNGHLLEELAAPLAAAGLHRVNISLDTVNAEQFAQLTRGGDLARVPRGIEKARESGLCPIKINAVMMAGENAQQLIPLIEAFQPYASSTQVRFIEAMPFGANSRRRHLSTAVMKTELGKKFQLDPLEAPQGGGPATNFRVRDSGMVVGFISPITQHFCQGCNRLRLMADGHLRTCLSRDPRPSLRDVLRNGASDAQLEDSIRDRVWRKVAGHEAHLDGDSFKPFEGVMTRIGG